MKYFAKSEGKKLLPVNTKSVSPTGKYFVGRYAELRETIFLFRTIHKKNNKVRGVEIMSYHNYLDTEAVFQDVVWYEEYGFLKLIFHIWGSMDSKSVRLYFDRELFEKKKKELHGK